jgi:hypothetical protein
MKAVLLGFFLVFTGAMQAAPLADFMKVTTTVNVDGLNISTADFILKKKKGYVYVLLDVMPYAKPIEERVHKTKQPVEAVRRGLLLALVEKLLPEKFPSLRAYQADVVEFTERDEYGLPAWSSIRRLDHFRGELGKAPVLSGSAKP